MFSHMTRDVSVVVKCDTIFRLFLLEITISNFRKVAENLPSIVVKT